MQTRTVLTLGLCGAIVLGVGLAYGLRGPGTARQEMSAGQLAFPGLAPRLQAASRVEVVRGDRTLVVEKTGERWGLPDRGSYPVQTEKLRGILTGLTELRLVEPRTGDPEQYSRLGLDDPRCPVGTAILLRVLDGAGAAIAQITLGHRRVRTQGDVPEQIYVRLPNQKQTWLADGRLAVDADPQLWLDRDLADLPKAGVAQVSVTRGADRLLLARQDGKVVLQQPAEHPPLEEYRADDVFRGLEALSFTDVQVQAKIPGDAVATSQFVMADGLTVTVQSHRAGEQYWVTLAATGQGAAPLQARWSGWAYQLGQWKEKALAPSLSDLVVAQPAASPALPATPPATVTEEPAPGPDLVPTPAPAPAPAPAEPAGSPPVQQ